MAIVDVDPATEAATVAPPTTAGGDRAPWRAGLAGVLLVAAGFRLWRLDQNGFGNLYYGAAVRSMLRGWDLFFFGSFDAAGIVTVDKPPVALWFQAIGAKLLGYGGLGVLVPQALMGVASVGLTCHLVRRAFGAGAGLLAGLALAITPICVAVDRDNLPDSALVLLLLLAAWALSRAAESGRLGPLLGAMALAGLGFNVKMLAAFVVLPTFVLAYAIAAPVAWRTRLIRLSASMAVLAATALSWALVVELTPKDRRPYIGGSRTNSALELAMGYNGVARIFGMGGFGPPGARPGPGAPVPARAEAGKAGASKTDRPDEANFPPPPGGPGGPGGGMPGFGGKPGFGRFANRGMVGLITWLFPMALLGGAVAGTRPFRARPIGREHVGLLLWAGWFGTHWVVFSFARGIFHEYYTTVMGPAVAALAGLGAVALWDESRRGGWRALLFPATIALTAAWQGSIIVPYPDWRRWLLPALAGGAGLGAAGLLAAGWLAARRPSVPWSRLAAGVGLASLLIGPAAWSVTPVLARGVSMMPTADPTLLNARRDGAPMPMIPLMMGPGSPFEPTPGETRKLVDFLLANRHGEPIVVAGLSCVQIAPILIESGEPAVAIGGFMGMDRALSKDRFVEMVEGGKLRFFLLSPGPGAGGGPPGGGPPGGMGNREIVEWVREHGRAVEPKLWRGEGPAAPAEPDEGPPGPGRMMARMRRETKLYDCRPDLGPVVPSAR